MQKQASKFVVALLCTAAMSVGCSSASTPAASATGGKGGGGSTGTGTGMAIALTPDATGYIDVATNSLGIKGAWYAYGDGAGSNGMAPGDCQNAGHPDTACSKITMPAPGSFPNTGGKMCTNGTVAVVADKVGMAGMPDYSKIWGAGIGVDLNNGGLTGKGVFDATANGVVGFSFDLDMKPLAGIRVEAQTVPTDGTEAGNDYWGATSSYPTSPLAVGTNTVHWSDIVGPKGHVFDPTKLEGLQFHVPASTSGGGPYSFCISNLKMLK
jgi:hypothetical protein